MDNMELNHSLVSTKNEQHEEDVLQLAENTEVEQEQKEVVEDKKDDE